MNIFLWVLQVLLAVAFGGAGSMKATQSKEKLQAMNERMIWTEDFSDMQIRIIGILEILAAIGLLLPIPLDILPILTPLAAIGLVLTMIGAIMTHRRRGEPFEFNIVLLILAAIVAVGRLFIDTGV